jgi:hypothetical protein
MTESDLTDNDLFHTDITVNEVTGIVIGVAPGGLN